MFLLPLRKLQSWERETLNKEPEIIKKITTPISSTMKNILENATEEIRTGLETPTEERMFKPRRKGSLGLF